MGSTVDEPEMKIDPLVSVAEADPASGPISLHAVARMHDALKIPNVRMS